jgi:hypothetical protein
MLNGPGLVHFTVRHNSSSKIIFLASTFIAWALTSIVRAWPKTSRPPASDEPYWRNPMNTQMVKFVSVLTLALAASSTKAQVFIPPPAELGDGKTYPGAMCRPDNRGAFWTAVHSGGQTISNFGNPSGGWVDCPVVRDVLAGKVDALYSATMKVKDPHSSQNVSCTLYSRNSDGTALEFSAKSTAGQSNSVQTLSFATLDSANLGYYYFLCQLPPYENGDSDYARIISYRIDEKP